MLQNEYQSSHFPLSENGHFLLIRVVELRSAQHFADTLALVSVGKTFEFELLLALDQALECGQFERGERAVPRTVERPNDHHRSICRLGTRWSRV
jgi:hypothetical protein